MIVVSVLVLVVMFGAIVSIKHSIRMKRRAAEQRQQELERIASIERSLFLGRR